MELFISVTHCWSNAVYLHAVGELLRANFQGSGTMGRGFRSRLGAGFQKLDNAVRAVMQKLYPQLCK